MIIRENIDNRFIKQYSDKGFYIKKVNTEEIYEEAIDLPENEGRYEETDVLIPVPIIEEPTP